MHEQKFNTVNSKLYNCSVTIFFTVYVYIYCGVWMQVFTNNRARGTFTSILCKVVQILCWDFTLKYQLFMKINLHLVCIKLCNFCATHTTRILHAQNAGQTILSTGDLALTLTLPLLFVRCQLRRWNCNNIANIINCHVSMKPKLL